MSHINIKYVIFQQTAKCVLLSHDAVSQMSSDLAEVSLPLSDKIENSMYHFNSVLTLTKQNVFNIDVIYIVSYDSLTFQTAQNVLRLLLMYI